MNPRLSRKGREVVSKVSTQMPPRCIGKYITFAAFGPDDAEEELKQTRKEAVSGPYRAPQEVWVNRYSEILKVEKASKDDKRWSSLM